MGIESESGVHRDRRLQAVAVAAAMGLAALLAQFGRVAESPAAASLPAVGSFGPGKIGQLRAMRLDSGGQPPENAAELGRAALASAPLAYEPFFAVASAGFRGQGANGSAQDGKLLREATRRNPRSRESHAFLMRHALGAGNLKEAIDEIAVLNRLTSAVADRLMPAVGKAISSEKQVNEVIAALAPHPELFEPFLRGFSTSSKTPAISRYLVANLPKAALDQPKVRNLAVKELVRAQAFAEARAMWGGSGKGGAVHSPDFSDTKAPPPFNWELETDSTGAAERQRGGGLSLAYYGREPGALASQLVTLAPGNYRARLAYRTTGGTPGALGFQLQCAGKDALLFDEPLKGDAGSEHVLLVNFMVPQQGCQGQVISLAGRLQESRDPQDALVRSLNIEGGVRP
ncbi:hypothetical protein [Novosphingobium sp. TH158]|uniref:hypothetical protein n=1 Tax=Novosphingobium sp. TH158 TaxID=2067455 RepID=UPI000C7D00BA|nr:hypothetical protein [Novosphingobium sp. TH158]PLK27151.1 hypothetical protein C0V78_09835 [Novosphingobium sp. TH158]